MSFEVHFQYKCRRCGEVGSGLCAGGKDLETARFRGIELLINAHLGTHKEPMSPRLLSSHFCKDNGGGITELIGFETKEYP